MEPMDLLAALNEAQGPDRPYIDKSQVYRWLKGQLPHKPTQVRIAAALELLDIETGEPAPELLMSHPAQSWIAGALQGLPNSEVERIRRVVELSLPRKTGTDN